MGNFAENFNLGKSVLPPATITIMLMHDVGSLQKFSPNHTGSQ